LQFEIDFFDTCSARTFLFANRNHRFSAEVRFLLDDRFSAVFTGVKRLNQSYYQSLPAARVSRIRDSKKRNAPRRKHNVSGRLRRAGKLWQIAVAPRLEFASVQLLLSKSSLAVSV
jgi:hypothetical protein